jgi:hypothetical protein
MRALMVALAIVGAAGPASAMGPGTTIPGGEVRESITPTVPANAPKQAEDAIKKPLDDPFTVTFRAVKGLEVASVRHGPFANPIEGPVSIICGQYGSPNRKGGAYSWFFVAIKRGKVLWTASDETSNTPDEAYDSCKGAGLAD